jgi:hypothetical protein
MHVGVGDLNALIHIWENNKKVETIIVSAKHKVWGYM